MSTNPECIDTSGGALSFAPPSWKEWIQSGLHLVARDMGRLVDVLLAWEERSRQRRSLYFLDDRMLTDMGLTRADVDEEARKPFWIP